MIELVCLCLLFVACVAFYQAGARRTELAGIKSSKRNQSLARFSGWGLAILALVLSSWPQGLERGVPIWLACFMLAAFSALVIGALSQRWQIRMAGIMGALGGVAALVLVFGG